MSGHDTYYDIYFSKYKKCKSKKEYKKLCREMIAQFDAIDKISNNQWRILSSIVGEDAYSQALALAIKMYILEQQGISCDIISCSEHLDI